MLVTAEESNLQEDSIAICSQIRTVSIQQRIKTVIGFIPDKRMSEVDTALEYSLGLRGSW